MKKISAILVSMLFLLYGQLWSGQEKVRHDMTRYFTEAAADTESEIKPYEPATAKEIFDASRFISLAAQGNDTETGQSPAFRVIPNINITDKHSVPTLSGKVRFSYDVNSPPSYHDATDYYIFTLRKIII